ANVERLIVDEKPEELAVRDVDEGLAPLWVAVGILGVRQGKEFEVAVEVGAGRVMRLPLIEVAPHADMAIGEREDRLRLAEQVEVQRSFDDRPRIGREHMRVQHHSSKSSLRSLTTMSAPCS